jgi:diguanylate cyclase (GGDEF)-like protein
MDQADGATPDIVEKAPDEASLRARAVLLVVLIACAVGVGQIVSGLAGLTPGVSLLVGIVSGSVLGAVLVNRLVIERAEASDRKRKAIIARIARVARTDREELFDDLLICEQDAALGPLAKAVHDALTRAHKDRLEAAALRREMAHKVNRETSKRTATLTNEAERDELTGLYNRRGFDKRLNEVIERCRTQQEELVLLAIDMDNFKMLNDTCGHEKGDEALRIAGDLLRAHTRGDDFAARVGGDELFLALGNVDKARALGVGERLIDLFIKHPAGNGLPCDWPGMSIGVARLIADGAQDADDLKRIADEALYESKRAGRGRVTFARAA